MVGILVGVPVGFDVGFTVRVGALVTGEPVGIEVIGLDVG
eukprot:CAMPEP_0201587532 /NCGR_PEP_ID=MMETSP0190_2-20130828/144604_1 /ASSEMBLY_ACC=CAM_ASM_000263 /TAXON_ID=37353 /ORGANISM="Rosalina sp." /LENGTH=39 /DNA_ID= /DNA_START= /DNA_END= /DNA_ORIENTATION=